MASYRPSRTITIGKPCAESWEAMPGDSRVRHCDGCGRDVRNVAAMTPTQIEEMIAQAGRRMCVRLVQNSDGSLLTAGEMPRLSGWSRMAVAVSTVLMAGSMAAQDAQQGKAAANAVLQGSVVDQVGATIPNSTVELIDKSGKVITAVTDLRGVFRVSAPVGDYQLDAVAMGFQKSAPQRVELHAGAAQLVQAIRLDLGAVTMGDIVVLKKPAKTKKMKSSKVQAASAGPS